MRLCIVHPFWSSSLPSITVALRAILVVCLWMSGIVAKATEVPEFKRVLAVLQEQCLDCHNSATQEGTIDLERFESTSHVLEDRALWKTVFDVVEAGQMPLVNSGYELSEAQRKTLLSFSREMMSRPEPELGAVDPGKPVLRRLSRLEYSNTVRDLFGLEYDIFMFPERLPVADKRYFEQAEQGFGQVLQTSMREYGQKYDVLLPQIGLPGDNRAEHGYANRGDALNFSPLLFEKYLQVANAVAHSERLLQDSSVMQNLLGVDPPKPKTPEPKRLDQPLAQTNRFALADRLGSEAEGNDFSFEEFADELVDAIKLGSGTTFDVPDSIGTQIVAGKGGLIKLQLGSQVFSINPNKDLWLVSFSTADETSGSHLFTNHDKGEKKFELTFGSEGEHDLEVRKLAVCVLARRGQSGTVNLSAVLNNRQQLSRQMRIDSESGNVFCSWAAPSGTFIQKLAVDGSDFSGDYVLLDDLAVIVNGAYPLSPNVETDPTPVEADLADESQATSKSGPRQFAPLKERVRDFLCRAYRRNVSSGELQDAVDFVEQEMTATSARDKAEDAKQTEMAALCSLVQRVLSSPEFLFISEPIVKGAGTVRQLSSFELANRLSYFLWASMPDEQLWELANEDRLQDDAVLQEQVARMLAVRRKSRELSESFASQWLKLDQLYSSKPDRKLFKQFYSGPQGKSTMHASMMIEVLLLFETVLIEDRSVLELYDCNYTWLNKDLARLYDLEKEFRKAHQAASQAGEMPADLPVKRSGRYWLRTELPDRSRGGVITMAGPLMLTSLPLRTSPIKRGAWLLETVFNRPPSEPKVAFVLEEVDANSESNSKMEEMSVRQRFEKHRSDPNCYSCHIRIDPPGFSLEAFDAIGAARTRDGSQPIDASGEWNNVRFDGPAEFKDAMLQKEEELVRGFVEHLLSYALGRELEYYDMPTVERIVERSAESNYRISRIIEQIVLSYPFRQVRNPGWADARQAFSPVQNN